MIQQIDLEKPMKIQSRGEIAALGLVICLILMFCPVLLSTVSGEVKRQLTYGAYPEDEKMKSERQAFEKTIQGEHPLARMERLAHGYAYGKGSDDNWNNKTLRRRMNVDGFDIVESMINTDDGTAGMVVKDRKTGRHIIVFRGTDSPPDVISDIKETTLAQIGQTQYATNRKTFDEWAQKYSKDGKLDVTGHSLGGGLAHIFTSIHGDKIKKVSTFQAPAQEKNTIDRYSKIPVEDRPEEVVLMVAAPDPVAHVGTQHAGVTKVIAGSADDMGIGHTSMLLQNKGVKNWQGKAYRSDDDNLHLLEMTPEEYQKNREPNILGTHDTWAQWIKKTKRMGNSQWRKEIKNKGKDPFVLAKDTPVEQEKKKESASLVKSSPSVTAKKGIFSDMSPKDNQVPSVWVKSDAPEAVFYEKPTSDSNQSKPCEEEFIKFYGDDGSVTIKENENFDPMCEEDSPSNTEESDCSKPLNSVVEAVNSRLSNSTPSQVASLVNQLLSKEDRQKVMNCLCAATSAQSSSVSKYYDPRPVDASPSCNDPGNGACVNQGFGCTRHSLTITKEILNECNTGYQLVKQLCESN